MSNPFDQFDNSGTSAANPFDQFDSTPQGKKQNKGIAGDLVTDLKRGVEQLPGIVTGVADIPIAAITGDTYADKAANALGGITGFAPAKWAKDAEAEYSPGRVAAKSNVDQAWEDNKTPFADAAGGDFAGIGQIAKSYVQNPQQLVGSVVESLPSMLGGAKIGQALTKAVGIAAPVVAGAVGEGAVMAGQQMNNLTEAGADPRTAAAASAVTGVVGGAVGAVGGKLAQRMGVVDPDTALAGGATRALAGETGDQTIKGTIKEGAKRIAGGAASEGLFEELPQSVLEQVLSNLAQGKPWEEGVGRSAVEGTLAGSLMGGAFNALPGKKEAPATTPPENEQPTIAGLLPAPTYTGTPGEQIIAADAERQAAIDAADTANQKLWEERDAYAKLQEELKRNNITIINDPEPLQQRIDALMGINEARLQGFARTNYEKAIDNAFGEQVGIVVGKDGLEVPFTMGDYLKSKIAVGDMARKGKGKKAPSAGISAAPVIPVVGPLSAVASAAVQSGAHQSAVMQQAAAEQAKTKPAGPLSSVAKQSEQTNGQIATQAASQVATPGAQVAGGNVSGGAGVSQSALAGDQGRIGSGSEVAAQGLRPAVSAGIAGGQAPNAVIPASPAGDTFIRTRTDAQLNWLAERGKPEFKEAAAAEIALRAVDQNTQQSPQTVAPTESKASTKSPEIPNGDGIGYDDFKNEMQGLLAKSFEYKPSEVGSGAFAQRMADLSDKYPEFSARLDTESDQEPVKNASPTAATVSAETVAQNQEPIKNEDDWLGALFGAAPTAAESASKEVQTNRQAQDKADRVDSAIAMLTGEIEASNATAAEVAARNYKSNRKQIELKGDGPGKNGSLSISAINESRKRRTVEALQNASSSIKQAIEFIAENPDAAFKQVADMEAAVTKQFNEGFFGPSAKLDGQLDMAVGSLIGSGSYSGEGSAGRKLRMAAHAYAAVDAATAEQSSGVQPASADPALQNRDRGRAASVNQMQSIARNPDYMRLGPSRTPDSGAPMVFAVGNDTQKISPANFGANDTAVMSDGQRVPFRYAVVDASQVQPSNFADGATNPEFTSTNQGTIKALNNGRTAGVRSAHSSGNAATYTAELLADNAHGVSPEAIRNTPNPMLVRVYAEQSNTGDMAAKSQGQGLGMSASERATQDAELMTSDALDKFAPGDIASAGNRDFVRAFVGKLAENELADMMDATGNLSQDGRRRIEAALLTAAYGKSDLVQELFESTDTDIKAIGNALKVMSGQWAAMRNAAKDGAIDPATDMTANLIEAVNIVRRSRAEGSSIAELAGQGDLMGGNYLNELSELFLRIFYKGKNYDRARGGDKVIAALQEVVTSAMNTKAEAGLFGDSFKATPKQIVESARSKIDEENKPASQSSLFGANGQATAVSQGNRSESAQKHGEVGSRPVSPGRGEEAGKQAEPVAKAAEPAPAVDSKQSNDADLESRILIAADSIDKLRKVDVERVLMQGNIDRKQMADYIKRKRPEFSAEVDSVIEDATVEDNQKSEALDREMAGFTGVNDAEYELRQLSRKEKRDGDIELGNGKFVTLEQAVAAAKMSMDPADWIKPFQFNRQLDIAPIDWNTMVGAMKNATVDAKKQEEAKPVAEKAANEKPADSKATADAGEELTYNKRNRRTGGLKWDDIKDKNAALRVKEVVKAKVYPKPDYQALVDGGMRDVVAHIVKQAYDAIAPAPKMKRGAEVSDAALQSYIAGVNRVMDGVMKWANDGTAVAKWANAQSKLSGGSFSISELATAESLLDTVYPGGWKASREEIIMIGGNKMLSALQPGHDEVGRAMKDIKLGWPAKSESWQKQGYKVVNAETVDVELYSSPQRDKRAAYVSGTVTAGNQRIDSFIVRGTADKESQEVQDAIAEKRKQLEGNYVLVDKVGRIEGVYADEEAAIEAAREKVKRESGEIREVGRKVSEVGREGVEHRLPGDDVTTERLKETFGFRGVNFGNWMKGETKAKTAERQLHLNHLFDAFMDLAQLLNVPPKAMSLNGMLGIAVGAQGSGKAWAHFVPGVNEINVTRTNGAGALAHEWGHALDHYFATMGGMDRNKEPYLSAHVGTLTNRVENGRYVRTPVELANVRPEVAAQFQSIVEAMTKRKETDAEYADRIRRDKDIAGQMVADEIKKITEDIGQAKGGWGTPSFIAEIRGLAERIAALDYGDGRVSIGSSEVPAVVAEIAEAYKAASGVPLKNAETLGYYADHYRVMSAILESEEGRTPREVNTDYKKASDAADSKKKPYWSTKLEMFARAFDAYVVDSLAEKAASNTYLAGIEAVAPQGDERKTIGKAFDFLFAELKTKETEQGVMLYNQASAGKISPADKAIYGMAAEGKSAAEVLKFIASASRSPFNRQVARLLLKTGIAPSITVGDGKTWNIRDAKSGEAFAAAYDPKTNTVALFRPASSERNMLHELVHAATIKALSKKGMASAQMKALFAHVEKTGKLTGMYGIRNVDEFIAEAFSNPKFQEALKQVSAAPVGGKPSSAWDWFVRIVRGILGVSANEENALAQALEIGVDVMRENKGLIGGLKNDNVRGMADKDTVAGTQAPTSAGDGSTGSATLPDGYSVSEKLEKESYSEPPRFLVRNKNNVVVASGITKESAISQVIDRIKINEAGKKAETQYRKESGLKTGYIRLYHGSPSLDDITEIKDEGIFRGIFTSYGEDAAGPVGASRTFFIDIKKSDKASHSDLDNAVSKNKAKARRAVIGYIAEKDSGTKTTDEIIDAVLSDDDRDWLYGGDFYRVEDNPAVQRLSVAILGRKLDGSSADISELSWSMQGIRGQIARAYGFKAVDMKDEYGISVLVLPGSEIKPLVKPNEPSASAGSGAIRYNVVDDHWDVSEQAKEVVMRLAGRPMLDPSDPFAAENARLREQDQSLWSKAKKQLRRYLAPGGLLPQSVFAEKIKRDSEFQAVEFDVRHLIGGLERAVKADFGIAFDKLSKEQMRPITEALAGNVPPALPKATKTAAVAMRQYIDGMSTEYLKIIQEKIDAKMLKALETGKDADKAQAINEIELFEKIKGNIGRYVHRSYQAFDDPKWFEKVPASTLNASRLYLKQGYMEAGETDAKAAQMAEVTLHEILKNGTAYDSMESFIAESKLGAKDLSVLMRRKEVPPQIRALLGEYPDARLNFTKSATKMGRLIWNTRFLDRVRDMGMGSFFFEGKDRPPNATTQIAADGSEVYAPLNGLWTFPETAQAFKDALGKEQMSDLYRAIVRANGLVKYGKTVLAPTTAMRNWQSAMFFSLANGHFDLTQMKKSISAFREQVSQTATGGDLKYLRHLKQLGVVYDTPYAGEMARLMEDARMEELLSSDKGDAVRWFRKVNQLAQGFYTFGDDFWKIIGFENEKAGLMKAGLSLQEAEIEAAKRIRDTYPTYSMVGRGVQWLSRFPLAGTFVSFPAEIIRTSANMLRTVAADLKSDNPKLRELGMKRAAGMVFVSAAFYSLAALSMAMAGVGDDEDEAIRDLAPEWQKNSTFLYLGRDEKGSLRYFDMSFLDPYGYWKRPITAMLRNQPWEDSLASGLRGMLEPFLGADISAKAIFEAVANKKESGSKVYKEKDGAIDQAVDIADHLRKALQPGVIGNVERLVKASADVRKSSGQPYSMEDELVALAGWRATTIEPKTALYYRSFEFTDSLAEARKTLTDTLRDANEVSPEDIKDARERAKSKQEQAFKEMSRLVGAAEAAGMSKMQIVQTLRLSNISQANIASLMRGATPDVSITPQLAARAVRQASQMRGPEFAADVFDRYRQAMAK